MSKKPKSPAEQVIEKFGGVSKTAAALGLNRSSVCLWVKRNKGQVPSRRWSQILKVSGQRGLGITFKTLMGV